MLRRTRRNLAAGAAVAVFVSGGGLAAMAATGNGSIFGGGGSHPAHHPVVREDLTRTAAYLGLSTAQLKAELQSGRTLAEIAKATPGKSEGGLIEALVAAKQRRLSAQAARLPQQVKAEVSRPGGPGAPARGTLYNARIYLGLSSAQLHSHLRSGMTLAQVANTTPGRSEAGLIEALVAAKREALDAAVAAGRLSKAEEQARLPKLAKRLTTLVNRKPAERRPS